MFFNFAVISRVKLHELELGEEEVVLTHKNQVAESESSSSDDDTSMADIFPSFSTLEVTTVKSYTMNVGNSSMDWEVLLDREHITEEENHLNLPDKQEFRGMDPDLFDSEENLLDCAAMFFKQVFPDVIDMTQSYDSLLLHFVSYMMSLLLCFILFPSLKVSLKL